MQCIRYECVYGFYTVIHISNCFFAVALNWFNSQSRQCNKLLSDVSASLPFFPASFISYRTFLLSSYYGFGLFVLFSITSFTCFSRFHGFFCVYLPIWKFLQNHFRFVSNENSYLFFIFVFSSLFFKQNPDQKNAMHIHIPTRRRRHIQSLELKA